MCYNDEFEENGEEKAEENSLKNTISAEEIPKYVKLIEDDYVEYLKYKKRGQKDIEDTYFEKISVNMYLIIDRLWKFNMSEQNVEERDLLSIADQYRVKAYEYMLNFVKSEKFQLGDLGNGKKSNLRSYADVQIKFKIGEFNERVAAKEETDENGNKIVKINKYNAKMVPLFKKNKSGEIYEEIIIDEKTSEIDQVLVTEMYLSAGTKYCQDKCDEKILYQIITSTILGGGKEKLQVKELQKEFNMSASAISQRKHRLTSKLQEDGLIISRKQDYED